MTSQITSLSDQRQILLAERAELQADLLRYLALMHQYELGIIALDRAERQTQIWWDRLH